MVDYKDRYIMLFRGVTKAIDILQASQQETEEKFINADDTPVIRLLHPDKGNDSTDNK